MAIIECTDRNGITRKFSYEYDYYKLEDQWHFRVHTIPPLKSLEFFELVVKPISPDTVQVVVIRHNYIPEYMAKGIPDALLPEVREVLCKRIVSSPGKKQGNRFRTVDAEKYWKRFYSKGLATYDDERS